MPNIDRQYKENIRAKLRLKIKTLLKRYRYPPDEQITAVKTVLQQADTLGEELVASKFFMFHQENRSQFFSIEIRSQLRDKLKEVEDRLTKGTIDEEEYKYMRKKIITKYID